MSTVDQPPRGYPAEITGYADPWIVSPGDTVAIKVSCTEPEYSYKTVRIIQGVEADHAPAKKEEVISAIPEGTVAGRYQVARIGSYGIVQGWVSTPIESVCGLKVSFYMQPWLPVTTHNQALLSTLNAAEKTGFAVIITEKGLVELWVGTGDAVAVIATGFAAQKKAWTKVTMTVAGPHVSCEFKPVAYFAEACGPSVTTNGELKGSMALSPTDPLIFGAALAESADQPFPRPTSFFNGRIEKPTIKTHGAAMAVTLVQYDFAREINSSTIIDVSGNSRHGTLVNAPTRAVKGHDWDGSEADWTKVKSGYGAIHFHEDDLDDAAWETDFTVTIPSDARSGAYAVQLASTNGKTTDSIPVLVRPSETDWNADRGKKVAFVLSTFTYLAYANEHLFEQHRSSCIDVGPGFDWSDIYDSENFQRMKRRSDVGISCYDVHNDDSGTVFSSAKRPILNMRPGYMMWAFHRPREFSADCMMIGFLEQEGIPYEVLTDHDLHVRGVAALAGFNTVLTGSHPEYPTLQSYNAYLAYARQGGGNLVYLGGNGFYWVASADMDTNPHRIEIRRGDQGVRTYTLPGAERVHATSGQVGGLWRSRGLACNVLFGIGFTGEGIGPGVPYRRSALSKTDPSVAWMFAGIGDDELIGVGGVGGSGGASGDEIDRFDVRNGSPPSVKVLGASIGHSDSFGLAVEDADFPIIHALGTQNPDIRSDLTYYTTSGGGGVFSVGSINWVCSLAHNGYQNNAAQLIRNVVHGFLNGLR